MKKRFAAAILMTLLAIFTACSAQQNNTDFVKESPNFTIGVLLKSMSHQHWMDVQSGILDAARELNVETVILYPTEESAIDEQKEIFCDIVSMKPDAILYAPCDSDDCKKYVDMAQENGIPVLTIDTRANDVTLPYIGADNRYIGKLAAEQLAKLTGSAGNIAIISGVKEQASHQERIDGFIQALKAYKNMSVVTIKYADSDFKLAMLRMKEVMDEYPDISGIFCTSAVMGLGVIEQKKSDFFGIKPYVVAVDTQDDALSALKNGMLDGLVSQDGYEAGYKSIYITVDMLEGREIPENTYISTEMLTRKTVDDYLSSRNR